MKCLKTEDAVGHILCHDHTQIIPGELKEAIFRKGHVVTKEDIPILLSMGKENLYVWENTPGMMHENDAAQILYDLCANVGMEPSSVKEGKIEVIAACDGYFVSDTERLKKVNRFGEMMIAARHTNSPVHKGEKLAGTRIIPLIIESEKMERVKELAGKEPLFRLYPYLRKKAGIVATGSEIKKGLIQDRFTPVVANKLAEYEVAVLGHTTPGDHTAQITADILNFIDQGAEIVLCTGGMSVDPDDRTPLAIKNTGAEIISYGAPVLPGAMFLLSYYNGVPVVGLPGCVMYEGRTVFDIILPRLLADIPVTADDLAALGDGGLCMHCPTCIFPICAFGAGV